MKKLTIFESGIIGFFIGIIVSNYLVFVTANDGYIGQILNYLSLKPVFDLINIPSNSVITFSFLFFVLVYTIYGLIIGLIIAKLNKSNLIVITLALIITASASEQIILTINSKSDLISANNYLNSAIVFKSIPKTQKTTEQYFGNEAIGDLNSDKKDDVAFLISRNDTERGLLYYLTTSISTTTGHIGTNLIFLGEKTIAEKVIIDNGIIIVDYKTKASTSTKNMFTQVINNVLQDATTTPIINTLNSTSTASTSISI